MSQRAALLKTSCERVLIMDAVNGAKDYTFARDAIRFRNWRSRWRKPPQLLDLRTEKWLVHIAVLSRLPPNGDALCGRRIGAAGTNCLPIKFHPRNGPTAAKAM